MHTYAKLPVAGEPPLLETYRFRCAEDVVAYAATHHRIGSESWPEVWHLDDHGTPTCCSRTTSLCSLQQWAYDPYPLVCARQEGVAAGGCGSNWLVVESRPRWQLDELGPVGPADRAAFLRVERTMARIGVRLVDAVIFDDECHWWSMRELTTGSTVWSVIDGEVA